MEDEPLFDEKKPDTTAEDAFRTTTTRWKQEHAESTQAVLERLSGPEASSAEKELTRAAAHDLALLEALEGSEIAVVRQLGLLVEAGSPTNATVLAAVLKDLSKIRSETTRRATSLLQATEAIAARRELTKPAPSAPLREA